MTVAATTFHCSSGDDDLPEERPDAQVGPPGRRAPTDAWVRSEVGEPPLKLNPLCGATGTCYPNVGQGCGSALPGGSGGSTANQPWPFDASVSGPAGGSSEGQEPQAGGTRAGSGGGNAAEADAGRSSAGGTKNSGGATHDSTSPSGAGQNATGAGGGKYGGGGTAPNGTTGHADASASSGGAPTTGWGGSPGWGMYPAEGSGGEELIDGDAGATDASSLDAADVNQPSVTDANADWADVSEPILRDPLESGVLDAGVADSKPNPADSGDGTAADSSSAGGAGGRAFGSGGSASQTGRGGSSGYAAAGGSSNRGGESSGNNGSGGLAGSTGLEPIVDAASDGPPAQACYLRMVSSAVHRSCETAGAGRDGAACSDSSDCAPGLGCVATSDSNAGSRGQCRTLACTLPANCAPGTYYDELPLYEGGRALAALVPVCSPADHCELLKTDSCSAMHACSVVGDGVTTCLPLGTAERDQPCSAEVRCAAGLVCAKTTSRCMKLCHGGTDECGAGVCQAGTMALPNGIGVCIWPVGVDAR